MATKKAMHFYTVYRVHEDCMIPYLTTKYSLRAVEERDIMNDLLKAENSEDYYVMEEYYE